MTTAEPAHDLETETGVVGAPALTDPSRLSPANRLLWLRRSLTALELDSSFLEAAEALRVRASDLRASAVEAQQQAAQRRQSALTTLGRDRPASLAAAVAVYTAESPWLDVQTDHLSPPAIEIAEVGARSIENDIAASLAGHASKIFDLVQRKATQCVDAVAALPAFPRGIWASVDPASDLARVPVHRQTWGILTGANIDFLSCHAVADFCRPHLGYGPERLSDGAPNFALWAKNWRLALDDRVFGKLRPQVRIKYALDNDWQPGLWRPEDISTTPADATFGAKLKNLGSAVFTPAN
jgi:hypothetical protein